MRKFRPLQEPIRLQDFLNSARSRAEKKDKIAYSQDVVSQSPQLKEWTSLISELPTQTRSSDREQSNRKAT